ncbi:MAG: Spy/CpxP family protein refolding chaperone [Advenella sp.]|uniref:LTXXQ motif family protein n=1 Tax=Advenella kashmirensis TaxID=310575 RepID=A0A356LHG2_9BURK|nr:hypothetical protein [Advenella kashmirensis]
MAVQFSGSFLVKSLLASALAAAVATTAFAQAVKADTESNPISPSVQSENTPMEYHRIGETKPQDGVRKHHKGDGHKHGYHRKGSMRHGAIVIPGLGAGSQALVDDLKVTDEQKATLKTIKDEHKAAREPNHEAFRNYLEERRKQLDSGKVDPKALLEVQKDMHEGFEKKMADDQAKWLGLWDTFSAEQKATVVKYFKDRSAKWEEHRKRFQQEQAKMTEAPKPEANVPASDSKPAPAAPKQ